MTTLVEFLRDRLDEDEQVANAAQGGPWDASETDATTLGGAEVRSVAHSMGTVCSGFQFEADRLHIARHDPARVLAEVEAKRRIISEWSNAKAEAERGDLSGRVGEFALGLALRALSLPYADHDDYRPEWRP